MTDDEQRRAFERVGRDLLAGELQQVADDVHTAMYKTASSVRDADELTERDVRRVKDSLSRAEMTLRTLYEAAPAAERPPDLEELLTQEELDEVLARSPLQASHDPDEEGR